MFKPLVAALACLLTTVCSAQPKQPIKDPPDRSFPNPEPSVSPTGEKFACPMKCEGEKTYGEAGRCPVCGMKLKQVATKTAAFSVKAEGDLISGKEVLLRVTAEKGHPLPDAAEVVVFNAKDEMVPAKQETLGNGDRKLRVVFPEGGQHRVLVLSGKGLMDGYETFRFAVARGEPVPPPEAGRDGVKGPIAVSWRTPEKIRAGASTPILIGITANKKPMWAKVHNDTRLIVFSDDMARAMVLRPEDEPAENEQMKFEAVLPEKGAYRLFAVHPLAEPGYADAGQKVRAE